MPSRTRNVRKNHPHKGRLAEPLSFPTADGDRYLNAAAILPFLPRFKNWQKRGWPFTNRKVPHEFVKRPDRRGFWRDHKVYRFSELKQAVLEANYEKRQNKRIGKPLRHRFKNRWHMPTVETWRSLNVPPRTFLKSWVAD